ncbi:MAG: hypothetical protein GC137_04195 [Alphaproteobacteria bacterium]|nr:hypothetical protein [Alphaproteobacteria bacterium]
MIDPIDPPAPQEKRLLMLILKVTFWISAFILVGITILANMGGNSDELKQTAQGFVSQIFSGRPAKIGTLNHMGFFPNVGFNADDIRVFTDNQNDFAIVHAKKVNVFMKFWDVVFQNPQFSHFYVEELHAIRGALGVEEVFIDKIFIDHDIESQNAVLRGSGTVGDYNWDFSFGLLISGAASSYKYGIPETVPVEINLAELSFTTTLINHKNGFYKLENFLLSSPEHNIGGNITLSSLGQKLVKAKGEILLSNKRTDVEHDLIFDYGREIPKVSGDLRFRALDMQDIESDTSAVKIFHRIREVTGFSDDLKKAEDQYYLLGWRDLDVDIQVDMFTTEHGSYEDFKFEITKEKDTTRIGPVLKDEKSVQPAFFSFPYDLKNKANILVLQSGTFDAAFWGIFIPDLQQLEKSEAEAFIKCGLGVVRFEENGYVFERFGIILDTGSIDLKTKKIGFNQDLSELKFNINSDQSTLDVIGLQPDYYNFLESYNKTQTRESGCAPYIFQAEQDDNQE